MIYVGSKRKIKKHIVPILQKCINDSGFTTYVEPFVGRGNIIDSIQCPHRIGYDINPYLIAIYNNIDKILEMENKLVSREEYYTVKEHKNNYPDWYVGYVGIFCSYGTKWFNGYIGESNGRNYQNERWRNFKQQIPLLNNVKFEYANYYDLDFTNCTIYCDPPYANYTTSKQGYNINTNFNHEVFWNWCRQQARYNHIFVSESTIPDDFEIVWSSEIQAGLTKKSKKQIAKLGYLYLGE